jgi:hypothetical protein
MYCFSLSTFLVTMPDAAAVLCLPFKGDLRAVDAIKDVHSPVSAKEH